MSLFEESKHPRQAGGRFGEKPDQDPTAHGRWWMGRHADPYADIKKSGTPAQDLFRMTDQRDTFQQVLDRITPEQKAKMAKALDEMSMLPATNAPVSKGGFVQEDGTYTPERQALHRRILMEKLFTPEKVAAATPAEGEKPVLTMTGGRPAAGKTSTFKKDASVRGLFISADDLQEHLPGYRGDHAGLYNGEGQDMATLAEKLARERGLHVIYDATMKSTLPAHERVDAFREAGYDVDIYFTHTTPAVSAVRSVARFTGDTGRFVPPELSYRSRTNEATFDSLLQKLRRWKLFDNNGKAPVLVAEGGKHVGDEEQEVRDGDVVRADLGGGAGGRPSPGAARKNSPEIFSGDRERVRGGTGSTDREGTVTSIEMFDSLPLEGVRKTSDDYLVTEVRAARVGIQLYRGDEVGRPDLDRVRVYRPPEEVFKRDAMASFTSMPVTVDHPPERVTAANWRKYAVGFTGEHVARDGGFVRVPLALKDADAIRQVEAGKKELSFGYACDMEFKSGRTDDGEEYDAVQRNLRGNHLAIVKAGRAGRDCRIGDGNGEDKMPDNIRKIMVDGIPVPCTDESAQVIQTLQGRIATLTTDNLKAQADQKTALDAKDATIAAKDKELGDKAGEIVKLKADVPDAAKIDQMVKDRSEAIGLARAIVDADYAGKSVQDIRRLAVQTKLGADAVKDRNDDYVQALFDALAKDKKPQDPIARDMATRTTHGAVADSAGAHAAMVAHIQDAWKGDSADKK